MAASATAPMTSARAPRDRFDRRRSRRWESGRQPVDGELEQAFGLSKSLRRKTSRARGTWKEPSPSSPAAAWETKDLAAVRRAADPGAAVNPDADVASSSCSGSAIWRPMRTLTCAPPGHACSASARLARRSRRRRVLRAGEDGEECVSLRVHDPAAVRRRIVPRECARAPGARSRIDRRAGGASSVEPSISVKRNATVPEGRLATGGHDRRGGLNGPTRRLDQRSRRGASRRRAGRPSAPRFRRPACS